MKHSFFDVIFLSGPGLKKCLLAVFLHPFKIFDTQPHLVSTLLNFFILLFLSLQQKIQILFGSFVVHAFTVFLYQCQYSSRTGFPYEFVFVVGGSTLVLDFCGATVGYNAKTHVITVHNRPNTHLKKRTFPSFLSRQTFQKFFGVSMDISVASVMWQTSR